jgi:hypothetical protein
MNGPAAAIVLVVRINCRRVDLFVVVMTCYVFCNEKVQAVRECGSSVRWNGLRCVFSANGSRAGRKILAKAEDELRTKEKHEEYTQRRDLHRNRR